MVDTTWHSEHETLIATAPLAGAAKVIACEWNPNAVEALHKNLTLNGVAERCEVLAGDNKLTAPKVVP